MPTHSPCVGRPLTQVDDHVKDRAGRAADELDLLVGRRLTVEAAERPGMRVPREAALDDLRREAVLGEHVAIPAPSEQPAFVVVRLGLDHVRALQSGRDESHEASTVLRAVNPFS
jgi:hypothetical protein